MGAEIQKFKKLRPLHLFTLTSSRPLRDRGPFYPVQIRSGREGGGGGGDVVAVASVGGRGGGGTCKATAGYTYEYTQGC